MSKFTVIKFLMAMAAAVICSTVMPLVFSGASGFIMFACAMSLVAIAAFCLLYKKQSDANMPFMRTNMFSMHDRAMTFGKASVYASLCFYVVWLMSDGKSTAANRALGIVAVFVAVVIIYAAVYLIFGRLLGATKRFRNKNIVLGASFVCILFNLLAFIHSSVMKIISFFVFLVCSGMIYVAMHAECGDVVKSAAAVFDVKERDVKKMFALSDLKGLLIAACSVLFLTFVFDISGVVLPGVVIAWPIICSLLLFASSMYVLKQPLDLRNKQKTDLYLAQREPAVKASLAKFLTNETDKIGVRIIMAFFVKPFCRSKAVGKENVPADCRVVFVSNHYEIYGPIASVCYMPFGFRPWIHNNMVEADLIEKQLQPGIDKLPLPKFIKKRLPHAAKKFILYVMHSTSPVPVRKESMRDVLKTISVSAEAMAEGDNLMVWPERPVEVFKLDGVDKLFSGFVAVASAYYKLTGKDTVFMPVYISKKKHKMIFGNGVKFDNQNSPAQERRRISQEMFEQLNAFAEQDNAAKKAK